MAKNPSGPIQNYLDALMSAYFKTAQDGRKLFYPRGVWGRGYAIASAQDYERVVREIKNFWVVGLVLWTIGAVALSTVLNGYLPLFISAAFLILLYFVAGAPHLVRGLQPSDERLTLQESYSSQLAAYGSAKLWWLQWWFVTQDGRKLFYPRGVWGRGYTIASEQDYERVVREIKSFWVVGLVLGTIGAVALSTVLIGYLPLLVAQRF